MDGVKHILVVDDDVGIRGLLSDFLARNGYRVTVAANGAAMMQTLGIDRINLVILDIMMPGEDGLSLCRRLRADGTMPIIMLTAVGGVADRIAGLEMGADDYLPKPFSTRELLTRIRAVLRRSAMPVPGSPAGARRVFEFAGWRLDVTRRQLYSPAKALVDLRAAEFDLLLALVERPNHVLARDQLLDLARGRGVTAFDRSIDVHISNLRKKLGRTADGSDRIRAIRGIGYIFVIPVKAKSR